MTLLDRLKKYIKHNFSLQAFTDYKTADNQIVTGDLGIGNQLLDLESMTPVDGEVIIDGKKVVVEKGIVKSVEDAPMPEMEMIQTECAEVQVEVCDECGESEEDCSCEPSMETSEVEVPEVEMAMPEMDTHMKDMMVVIDTLKSEIENLKSELDMLKADKTKMTSKIEELSNQPVQEVFKAVEPIKSKTSSRESLLSSLKEIKKSIQ